MFVFNCSWLLVYFKGDLITPLHLRRPELGVYYIEVTVEDFQVSGHSVGQYQDLAWQ